MPQLDLAKVLSGPPPKRSWLIPKLLPTHGIYVLAGEAGVGKSVLSYYLSMSLAAGSPVMGSQLDPRRVLYFDEENSEPDLRGYLYKLWGGLEHKNASLLTENLRIEHLTLTVAESDNVLSTIAPIVRSFKPELVVIDTYIYAFRFKDENSNAEHFEKIRKLRALKAAMPPEVTFLLLHHARYTPPQKRGAAGVLDIRGGKALKGSADGIYLQKKDGPGRRTKSGLCNTRLEVTKGRIIGQPRHISIQPTEQLTGALHLSLKVL